MSLPPSEGPLSLVTVTVQVIHDALPVPQTPRVDLAPVPPVLKLDVLETRPLYLETVDVRWSAFSHG